MKKIHLSFIVSSGSSRFTHFFKNKISDILRHFSSFFTFVFLTLLDILVRSDFFLAGFKTTRIISFFFHELARAFVINRFQRLRAFLLPFRDEKTVQGKLKPNAEFVVNISKHNGTCQLNKETSTHFISKTVIV